MSKKELKTKKAFYLDFLKRFDKKVSCPDIDQLRVRGRILQAIGLYESLICMD